MNERLHTLPAMNRDVPLYQAIFSYTLGLAEYIEQQHGWTRGEGLRDIWETLESGLGTNHAKIWMLTHGLSEEHFGQQIRAAESRKIVGSPYHTYMHGVGLSILQGCYPEYPQGEKIISAMEQGLYQYKDGRKQIPRINTYVKARRTIQYAIEQENLMDIMRTFCSFQYVDEFCQWYRVGQYKDEKSVGMGGTGRFNASKYAGHIVSVETFVESVLSGEFGIPLAHQYGIDLSGYNRKEEYLKKYRMTTAERKKSYELFLALSRIYADKDNFILTPLQENVVELWLSEALNGNMLRIDSTGYIAVAAEIKRRYPYIKMNAQRVHVIINGLLKTIPDHELATKMISRRIRMWKALHNADMKNNIGIRTKNLWTDIEKILNEYHHGTTIGVVAENKRYQRSFVTRLRLAMEIIMGRKSIDKLPHPETYENFLSFWPKEHAENFPDKIQRILILFAEGGITTSEIAQEIGGGMEERHVEVLIAYMLGEIPKRIDRRLLNGYKRKYYLEKISQEDLSVILRLPQFQHCKDADIYVFRLSTETISPPEEEGILFVNANQLAKKLNVKSHKISFAIRNVTRACEDYFGPIPEDEMKKIIDKSAY